MSLKRSISVVEPIFQTKTFDSSRLRYLTVNTNLSIKENDSNQCVLVWMSRDQRVNDNYCLLAAQELAQTHNVPIKVIFNLVPKFLQATLRQYDFMITGLKEVEETLRKKDVPMILSFGDPVDMISQNAKELNAIAVITDFSPLRVSRQWTSSLGNVLDGDNFKVPLIQVDAHNIVPCWIASNKLEYGARTIRGKIHALLPKYLLPFPEFLGNSHVKTNTNEKSIDWDDALNKLEIDRTIKKVSWLVPGEKAASDMLQSFVNERLIAYSEKRNDPNENALSNLSPYYHFGHISPQTTTLYVRSFKDSKRSTSVDAFVEESVVRRELSENFCYYNPRYDSLESCYDWAKETLRLHASDEREHLYTKEQLEKGCTHDDLWNASQFQLVSEGKMHGFLRMYWAKKILEWTKSPEEALEIAIYLNDRYSLDGRDPNGYVGCMWSIGGIHDQGWGERAIFGKIRYMNYKGCQRKFDVKRFVSKYTPKK